MLPHQPILNEGDLQQGLAVEEDPAGHSASIGLLEEGLSEDVIHLARQLEKEPTSRCTDCTLRFHSKWYQLPPTLFAQGS